MRTIFKTIKTNITRALQEDDPGQKVVEEQRSVKRTSDNSVLLGLFGYNKGEYLTEEEAMRIPAFNSAVELITSTVATLPVYLYRKDSNNNIKKINDERVHLLNNEPNLYMNGYNFKKQITKDLLLYGSSYIYMMSRKDSNKKDGFHILPSKDVTVEKYIKNGFVSSAQIIYQHPELDEPQRFDHLDLIIPLKDSRDGVTGTGVLETGNDILTLAKDEIDYSASLLQNGALPMATLETASKLTGEAAERLKRSFDENYAGSANAHKTLVLEDGLKYNPVSLKPNELELSSSRAKTMSDIARLLNIPESMINSEANKYSSNEQNNIHFLQYCIAPIINSIESALNKSLLLESEKQIDMYWKFDTSSILQTTEEQKVKVASEGLKSGIFTINEARRKLNLKDITQHDYYSRSLGDIFIDADTGKMLIPNLGRAIDPNNVIEVDTFLEDEEVEKIKDKMDKKPDIDLNNTSNDD